jgi:hypothetical protein
MAIPNRFGNKNGVPNVRDVLKVDRLVTVKSGTISPDELAGLGADLRGFHSSSSSTL